MLVKIALGCSRCPWQGPSAPRPVRLHPGQRAAHSSVLYCSAEVKNIKRELRWVEVKISCFSLWALLFVTSRNVSSINSFAVTRCYSRTQSDGWQHWVVCDTWARKHIVWDWTPFWCEEAGAYIEHNKMWLPTTCALIQIHTSPRSAMRSQFKVHWRAVIQHTAVVLGHKDLYHIFFY